MKKNKLLFLFMIVVFAFFIVPKDVFAENATIKFKTLVKNWRTTSDLEYSCGSAGTTGVSPTVYTGTSMNNLTPVGACNFAVSTLNYESNATFYIVEKYDFSSYEGTNPEYEDVVITPGHLSSNSISYDSDSYMFGDYDRDNKSIVLYNMNQVDDDNNITGPLYVSEAYYDSNGDKLDVVDLGEIKLPSYCVTFHFAVKGNIANAYGHFSLTALRTDDFAITGENGDEVEVCNVAGTPLTQAQFEALIATDADYIVPSRQGDYDVEVTDDGASLDTTTGVNSDDVYVTATLNSDGSQTGLLYTIIPFVLLIGLITVGYLFIRHNEIKEDVI